MEEQAFLRFSLQPGKICVLFFCAEINSQTNKQTISVGTHLQHGLFPIGLNADGSVRVPGKVLGKKDFFQRIRC